MGSWTFLITICFAISALELASSKRHLGKHHGKRSFKRDTHDFVHVADRAECGGKYKRIGRLNTVDACASRCQGVSQMFISGTNEFGAKKCHKGKCHCYCELSTVAGECLERKENKGYKLYAFEDAASCTCTNEYDIEENGKKVESRCADWSDVSYNYCYLPGGEDGTKCPGAVKSNKGNFYWSAHQTVCPSNAEVKCSQTTKLKAMYSSFTFNHNLRERPVKAIEVRVVWNKFSFYNGGSGGTYAAYTIGSNNNGPGGYFGDQMTSGRGQFLFSIWDGDRKGGTENGQLVIKKSSKLTWPLDLKRCKRNCQDCGMSHLGDIKKADLSTGTQCKLQYPNSIGTNGHTIRLERIEESKTINTADYGGMPKSHESIGETDRDITGSVWRATAINYDTKTETEFGTMLLEDATALTRLGSFDEMLGCRKCQDVYHKDTRYGPIITYADDGSTDTPVSVKGKTRKDSSCKEYRITGSKEDNSIVFESGPGTEDRWETLGESLPIW